MEDVFVKVECDKGFVGILFVVVDVEGDVGCWF